MHCASLTDVGESGLDGTTVLPKPIATPQTHPAGAIGAMHAALSACPPQTAWLVTTGTLTNAALFFAVYPEMASHIAGLSIMGGAVGNCFTYAPMGKVTSRVSITPDFHKRFPGGLPKGSKADVIQEIRSMKVIENEESITDAEIWDFVLHSRDNFGNWSPYAEFNVSHVLND
jgi:Inosine-uridine preferring nucleoside hydrolase